MAYDHSEYEEHLSEAQPQPIDRLTQVALALLLALTALYLIP